MNAELRTDRLRLQPQSYDTDGRPTKWDVVDDATGLNIGTIGFFGQEPDGGVAVGYEIANDRRGRGYATEALIAVLAHVTATGQATSVVAETEIDHAASRRVMEKAGMQLVSAAAGGVRYRYDCSLAVRSAP